MRSNSIYVLTIIWLAVSGCSSDTTGGMDDPARAAVIEMFPRNLLLNGEGDSWQLEATVMDDEGRLLDVPVTWEVDDPSVVAVDEDGVATALADTGSTAVRAVVGDVRSLDGLIYPAVLQPNAFLFADSQLVGDAELVGEPAEVEVGVTRFRVEVRGAEEATVGAPIVAREESTVVGLVTSIDGDVIELELAALPDIFYDLEVDAALPLGPDPTPGMATEALRFAHGPLTCTLESGTTLPEVEIVEPLDVTLRNPTSTRPGQPAEILTRTVITRGNTQAVDVYFRGEATIRAVADIRVPNPLTGGARCEIGESIPIPIFGPLSKFLTPQVKVGAGVHVTGALSGAELGARLTFQMQTGVIEAGLRTTTTGFEMIQPDFSGVTFEGTGIEPMSDLSSLTFEVQAFNYIFWKLQLGSPIIDKNPFIKEAFRAAGIPTSLEFKVDRVGVRHSLSGAVDEATQLNAADVRTHYSIQPVYQVKPGSYYDNFLKLLRIVDIDLTTDDLTLEISPDFLTDVSPTGTTVLMPQTVPPDETVTIRVNLDNLVYVALPNLRHVHVKREVDGVWTDFMDTTASASTRSYDFTWTPTTDDVGPHRIAVLVETNFLPGVLLEIENDSRRTITVEGDVQPFETIELSDPAFATYSFTDINDMGQLVGTEPSNPFNVVLTPGTGTMGEPVWWRDSDGDSLNDLVASVTPYDNGRGPGAWARPTSINNSGHVAGTGGELNTRGGTEAMAAYWPSLTMPVNVGAITTTHIRTNLFPMYGISYRMLPKPNNIKVVNDSGMLLINAAGTSITVQGMAVRFVGGDPICRGCIAGRTNVGNLEYAVMATGADMNDAGRVCGVANDPMGVSRAATWSAMGMPTFLGDFGASPFGSPATGGAAINNAGQVVGSLPMGMGGPQRPVVWMGTSPMDLGTFGGTAGHAVDIDDMGAVIGWAHDAMDERRGFLYLPATRWGVTAGMHDLATLVEGTLLPDELPIKINNNGVILTSEGRLLRARPGS